MHQPLVDYIKQARAAGMKDDQIQQELLKVSWKKEYVEEALRGLGGANQIKFNPKIIIFVVLGIILIGAIAFGFWYADKTLNWGILSQKQVTNNLTPEKMSSPNNLPRPVATVSPNPSGTASPQPSATGTPRPGVKDCGSFDSTNLANSTPFTAQDIAALSCFNEAANNCDRATINSSEKQYGSSYNYKILLRDNDNCQISYTLINEPKIPKSDNFIDMKYEYFNICSFPMSKFIVPTLQEMKKHNDKTSSIGLIFAIGFSFVKGSDAKIGSDGWYDGKITNTQTKEDISYKCK